MQQIAIKKIGILRVIAQLFFVGRSLAEKHPAKAPSLGCQALIISSLGLCASIQQRDKHLEQIMSGPAQVAKGYAYTDVAFQTYVENPLHGTQAVIVQPDPIDHAMLMLDIH